MKKAIITLTKRMKLDATVKNPVLQEMLSIAYQEVVNEAEMFGVRHYDLSTGNRATDFKQRINGAAILGCFNAVFKLNRYIPDLWDVTQRFNVCFAMENMIPKVRAEVLSFFMNEKEKFELAVYFETESFVLLDSIGDKLLLAFPNETGEDDQDQTFFENTFFLQLADDIYFKDYKILQS